LMCGGEYGLAKKRKVKMRLGADEKISTEKDQDEYVA